MGQRIAQFDEEIIGLEGQVAAEDVQLLLIAEETNAVLVLLEKGLERKPRLLALQRREAEIVGSRSGNMAQVARVKQNIGEARLRISELDTARINEVVEQLRAAQNELFDLAERIHAAEDILRRTAILAIQDGTVVNLQVHTPGGVIAPGAPLLDIVPSDDALIIEARVDPRDIDVVHWGLPARVRLTAFNQRSAVPMDGRVLSVSADAITDERTGQAYYLARIKLDKDPATLGTGISLYPGMQAEVMIVTGARTVLDYLLAPISRSIDRSLRED
ncbi:MAG: HlyD family type I secretion periplasmic adaptor subunit [Alphaproteobacteria bacterium]